MAKTSFAFYFLVLFFVLFGGTRARDCYLKGHATSSYTKCRKQCCGSDGNDLRCLDTCNGISCTGYDDCDEGCCVRRTGYMLRSVCRDCPTQPPETPSTPWTWTKTRSTTERRTPWKTRSTSEQPTPLKLALSKGEIRLLIGFGCTAVVVAVVVYYALRYYSKQRRNRRRRAVVVVARERPTTEIGVVMVTQTKRTITTAQPTAATVGSTAANYGFRPEYGGHAGPAMPNQYAPPPYRP